MFEIILLPVLTALSILFFRALGKMILDFILFALLVMASDQKYALINEVAEHHAVRNATGIVLTTFIFFMGLSLVKMVWSGLFEEPTGKTWVYSLVNITDYQLDSVSTLAFHAVLVLTLLWMGIVVCVNRERQTRAAKLDKARGEWSKITKKKSIFRKLLEIRKKQK